MTITGFLLLLASAPLAAFYSGVIAVKMPRHFKKYLWLYVAAFAYIAYAYTPNYTNDLMRYFAQIEACKDLPFAKAFTWNDDGLVVKNFLFWVLAQLDQPHLLPALSTGALYGVTAYIACDSLKNKENALWKVMLFQIALLPLHLANSNARNMLAFALGFLAVYRDFVQKKRNGWTWFLYLAPVFIHITGLLTIAVRIIVPFFRKHLKATLVAIVALPLIILGLYPVVIQFVLTLQGNLGNIIRRFVVKSYTSILSNSAYQRSMQDSGYMLSTKIIMFFVCVILMILTFRYFNCIRARKNEYRNFMAFHIIFCLITCLLVVTGAAKYWVFAVAVILSSGPTLSCYFDDPSEKRKKRCAILIWALAGLGAMRVVLEIYYLVQRVDLGEYFLTLVCSNIYTIVASIFYHLAM